VTDDRDRQTAVHEAGHDAFCIALYAGAEAAGSRGK
jgi:hypothetical protein